MKNNIFLEKHIVEYEKRLVAFLICRGLEIMC